MTITFKAKYYNGQKSANQDLQVAIDDDGWLHLLDCDIPSTHMKNIVINARVGNSMRYLTLPDGACLETSCNDEVDEASRNWGLTDSTYLHLLERSTKIAFIAILILVVGSYFFVTKGIPALAFVITSSLPISVDERLGGEILEQLDQLVFAETQLDISRQRELEELFVSLTPDDQRNYQLRFRSSRILGANAIALPDAQIVFTDQLINLSEDDNMIAGIMLHEIGHVKERHAMQAVVRQAGLSLLIVALTGDVNTAATTLLVLFPSFLIQSQYSRNLEWSADTYALEQMLARGIDTGHFADIMQKMTQPRDPTEGDARLTITDDSEESGILEYFSTHPATQERIARFRNAAR